MADEILGISSFEEIFCEKGVVGLSGSTRNGRSSFEFAPDFADP
jgi:hypothetical protein